jgi:hypothetical protein
MSYRALVSAVNHPDPIQPYITLFNRQILKALSQTDLALDVVVPRPFAPPAGPYSEYSSIPEVDRWPEYETHHPRFLYLYPKRLFYGLAGRSLRKRLPRYAERTFDVPDVVHACDAFPDGYAAIPYCRDHDLPLFVTAHGQLLNTYDELPWDVQRHVRDAFDECSKVLCVSDALTESVRRFVPDSKIELVPIGATPDRYPTDHESRLRAELGIGPDETVVLFVGQFIERKGVGEIIDILPDLDLEDTVFVFVGHRGDMQWAVKRALLQSPFASEHIYVGVTSLALRRWFVVADLFMLPSYAEGRPTVIYEAMAAETAVLGTDVDGIPEQVVDGETGVLVPPRDADALTSALTSLVRDRARLESMGEHGLQRLLDKGWTWEAHAQRLQALYTAVIESNGG